MAAGDLALNILINGNAGGANAAIRSVSGSLSMLTSGNVIGAVAVGAVAVTAAIVGIGIASVKMAGDYERSMNMVKALTGANDQQMAQYDTSLKSLAMDAGVAPTALAKGLYNVLSAGYSGATAMQVLTLATQDAKIGMTDSAVTSNALTVALRAFNVPAKDFVAVNGEMLRTVTAGKMSMADYASAISKTSSVAVQYKDTMSDMNAVLATLTSSGIKNANVAGTDYNNLLKVLNGNTASVIKKSEALNPAFNGSAFAAMNVHDKVMYLNSMIVQHGHNISEVIGKQQNAAAAFTMLSTHASTYETNLKNLSNQQQNAAATQQAWAITQGGFNQTMDRLHATLDVVLISIGQKLLPVFTKMASNLLPVIQGFGAWITKSGILDSVASGLTKGIAFLVGVITNLVNTGTAVVSFFQNNQLAMDGLKAVLAGVAAGVLAFAITTIPPLVVAFGAWAVAAGAAALATLVAAAPFILIGLVVAAVVFGIILAVQHWGQITTWLKGVWSAFSGWFMGAMNAVGQFFVGLWQGLVHGVQAAWAWIVNAVKIGVQFVFLAIFGPFIAIGALFQWLYNHNTYFKQLIDAIVGFVKAGVKWLQDLWTGIVNWIVAKWNYLHAMATVYFTMLYYVIYSKILQVQNFVHGILVTIGNFFIDRWNTLVTNTTALWNKISGIFSSAWNTYIAGPLGSLWNSISGWFKQLGQGALDSGKNFIQMLVNGITSGAGAIWNAVTGIAHNIWSALGFHSPTEAGPGRDADRWMPNLINMMVAGLNAGVPAMHRAALNVAAPLAQLSGGGSFALSGAHAGNAFALSGSNGSAFALGNGGQTIVIQVQPATANITMDHRKVGEGVMQYAQKEIRLQGAIRNR